MDCQRREHSTKITSFCSTFKKEKSKLKSAAAGGLSAGCRTSAIGLGFRVRAPAALEMILIHLPKCSLFTKQGLETWRASQSSATGHILCSCFIASTRCRCRGMSVSCMGRVQKV